MKYALSCYTVFEWSVLFVAFVILLAIMLRLAQHLQGELWQQLLSHTLKYIFYGYYQCCCFSFHQFRPKLQPQRLVLRRNNTPTL